MLAITYKKITKIKVAEWGTPKKYLKKLLLNKYCKVAEPVQCSL
jgi:hypothetical protein